MCKDITADFNGVITDIKVNEGSYTQPGSVILVLQDLQNVKGISLIPQQKYFKCKSWARNCNKRSYWCV